MKPLLHLWRAIESVPGLKAVEAEWIHRLSTELEPLRPYLVLTSELATCYPVLDHGDPRPIVAHASDDYAAICPDGGVALALRRADVAVYRFDSARLARAIGIALGVSGDFSPVPEGGLAWRIGTLPLNFGARPAYMAIPTDSQALNSLIDAIALQCKQPYVLLAPTRRWLDARAETRLAATDGAFLPVCDLFQFGPDGRLQASPSVKQTLGAMFGVLPAGVAANVFQRQGDKWVVSFEGTTIYPADSAGLIYIAKLLAEPDRDVPVVLLYSTRAGIDPRVASGSSGEFLTNETRENYTRHRNGLQEELQEAQENYDIGRIEKLEGDIEMLNRQLISAIGLGGRSRQKSDIEKIRKSVSTAISRAIEKIDKKNECLGRHLTAFITTGLMCRYAPERDPGWLT